MKLQQIFCRNIQRKYSGEIFGKNKAIDIYCNKYSAKIFSKNIRCKYSEEIFGENEAIDIYGKALFRKS